MKIPPFLKKGDTILIIATARKTTPELMQPAIEELRAQGWVVETGQHLYAVQDQFAGNDTQRAADLQWAIDHPSAKAVIVAGGGYGTVRIIDQVSFTKLKKFPKWFCGYSDATVLHSRLHQLNFASIHSTMAFQFIKEKASTQTLIDTLKGKKMSYTVPGHALNRSGKAEGLLCGGNLSLLYALAGSKDDISTKGKILFIEDLDEYLYHVDRMMMQLKRSGKLKGLKGLVVGGMSDMKDNAVPFGKNAHQIILDAVKEYSYPVCFDFPAGHVTDNSALQLGNKVKLKVDKKGVQLKINA